MRITCCCRFEGVVVSDFSFRHDRSVPLTWGFKGRLTDSLVGTQGTSVWRFQPTGAAKNVLLIGKLVMSMLVENKSCFSPDQTGELPLDCSLGSMKVSPFVFASALARLSFPSELKTSSRKSLL